MTNFVKGAIDDSSQQFGQQLPCSVVAIKGSMVTVKFEVNSNITFPQITVPQAISRYARPPIQIGDKGFLTSSDVYLGGVTGLGGGVADYSRKESNLSTLVFVPLSNVSFPSVDTNAYNITGPNGAVIQDDSGNAKITLTPSQIVLSVGGNNVTINSSGVSITGTLTINGKPFLSHEHSGVTAGSGNTGAVVP
jgi:hypothetical protein